MYTFASDSESLPSYLATRGSTLLQRWRESGRPGQRVVSNAREEREKGGGKGRDLFQYSLLASDLQCKLTLLLLALLQPQDLSEFHRHHPLPRQQVTLF